MTTFAPCANPTCTQPTALDHAPTLPAGLLCTKHLLAATGLDLTAVDSRQSRCQHAAATCGEPATIATLIGGYCTSHTPRPSLILKPRNPANTETGKPGKYLDVKRAKDRRATYESEWDQE